MTYFLCYTIITKLKEGIIMFGNYGYGYPNYLGNYQQQPQVQQQQPIMPKTNKVFVTSLDDAMARAVEPNSETLYLHQDRNLIFDIKTDMQGKKTWKAYEFKEYVEQEKTPVNAQQMQPQDFVSKETFEAFKSEIKANFDDLKSKIEVVE